MTPDAPAPSASAPRRDPELRRRLQARLDAFDRHEIARPDARRAAVALAIVDEGHGADVDGLTRHAAPSDRAALLLTRRSASLRAHAGQWALPGGRLDDSETPADAALRELAEEVGLVLPAGALMGRLDDYATRSGYVITPLVVWAGAGDALVLNPAEVDSVHRIPFAELLRSDAPILEPPHEPGGAPVLKMPVGTRWIAAPTAAFLYQFSECCLHGRTTRVAHFDQPMFAWR
jgi:8-oxo-dGTP pyrophosphatase MutT (NUDIX family)